VLGAVAVSYPIAEEGSQCRGIAGRDPRFRSDGVLVDSPRDLAWREALQELMEGDRRYVDDRTRRWSASRGSTPVAGSSGTRRSRVAVRSVASANWTSSDHRRRRHHM
jgi:superfamily II DNA helicase RecQ